MELEEVNTAREDFGGHDVYTVVRSVAARLEATDATTPKRAERALRLVIEGLNLYADLSAGRSVAGSQGVVGGAAAGFRKAAGGAATVIEGGSQMGLQTKTESVDDSIAMLEKQVSALCKRACEGVLAQIDKGPGSVAQLKEQRIPQALKAVLAGRNGLTSEAFSIASLAQQALDPMGRSGCLQH